MKGFVLAFLVPLASGHLYGALRRHPWERGDEGLILQRFLINMVKFYNYRNSEIIVLIRDNDFDLPGLLKHGGGTFYKPFRFKIMKEMEPVWRILKIVPWSKKTLFVMVLKRKRSSDVFFADIRHQRIDFEVVRAPEIEKDFAGNFSKMENFHVREMKEDFSEFWRSRITNVIALLPMKSKIYVYTYFPFTEVNCQGTFVPVLVNVWFIESEKFYRANELYPDKAKNFHRCPFNISLIPIPPGVMAEKGTIDGIEGELLKYAFHSLNATPLFRFVNSEDVSLNDSDTALNFVLENIRSGKSELGAGFLIPTSSKGATDKIYISLGLCLTWAVPRVVWSRSFLGSITDTFRGSLWAIVFCTMVLSILILRFLLRSENLSTSVFRVIAVTLGKAIILPEEKLPKIFLITFIWYSIVLGSVFQAGLGSNNIVAGPPPQYESTKQIIKSGFEITVLESSVRLFQNDIKLVKENGMAVPIEPMDIHKALLKVAFERKTAYFGLRLAIIYSIQFINPDLKEHVYVHKKCLLNFQPFFAVRKNSPLGWKVRDLMYALIESGIKDKLERKYLDRLMNQRKRTRVVKKGDALAKGSLLILRFGLGLSIIVFIGEVAFYYFNMARLGKFKKFN